MLENLTERKSFSETQMAKISNTVVSDHKKKKNWCLTLKDWKKDAEKNRTYLNTFTLQ